MLQLTQLTQLTWAGPTDLTDPTDLAIPPNSYAAELSQKFPNVMPLNTGRTLKLKPSLS
jgi:hypothetical protein